MVENAPERATRLLNRMGAGDTSVSAELLELIYGELRQLARAHMAREDAGHTLQPTALVHEAWLRIQNGPPGTWESRKPFYAMASKVMRSLLVDHAREKGARKRGGDRVKLPLEEGASMIKTGAEAEAGEVNVLDLNAALEKLDEVDPDLVRIVELRFFGGLTVPETARTLDVPLRTAERRLRVASAWLREQLA